MGRYGQYFLADLMGSQDANNRCLVAEVSQSAPTELCGAAPYSEYSRYCAVPCVVTAPRTQV